MLLRLVDVMAVLHEEVSFGLLPLCTQHAHIIACIADEDCNLNIVEGHLWKSWRSRYQMISSEAQSHQGQPLKPAAYSTAPRLVCDDQQIISADRPIQLLASRSLLLQDAFQDTPLQRKDAPSYSGISPLGHADTIVHLLGTVAVCQILGSHR